LLAVLVVVSHYLVPPDDGLPAERAVVDSTQLAFQLLSNIVVQLSLLALFLFAVVVISQPKATDLGLPTSRRQAVRDVFLGVLTYLAAYPFVFAVYHLVAWRFGDPELHPMIQKVREHPDPLVFIVASFSAVVAAPVCEEVVFRVLLQGWLEKWEDSVIGWRRRPTSDESLEPPFGQDVAAEFQAAPPVAGVGWMPYGSLPILVSSFFFAAGHLGHSTDPFPLFALALFLGFVYQRTHRILPCIVAHAMFNLISMFVFWRMLFAE
jgi:membrane protease YdiL (CAAX protease family)